MNEYLRFEQLIEKFFKENSAEKISIILKKYDAMDFEGVAIGDYLASINRSLDFYSSSKHFKNENQRVDEFNSNYHFFKESQVFSLNETISFNCTVTDFILASNLSTSFAGDGTDYRSAA